MYVLITRARQNGLSQITRTLTLDHALKLSTHRLHSSSFLGLPDRISNMDHKKGTTMEPMVSGVGFRTRPRP